jgi:hypothetical protein
LGCCGTCGPGGLGLWGLIFLDDEFIEDARAPGGACFPVHGGTGRD